MAKKPRTPDPPRKVQAPKVRQKQSAPGGGFAMPGTNVLVGVGLVGVVALAIALIVVLSGNSGNLPNVTAADVTKVRTAMTAAGCTLDSQRASAQQQHMSEADQAVSYRTFPASSGIHNPTTSIWGNYRLPVDPRQAVHNLEHGGIAIWYGPDISAADRGALDRFYDEDENGIIISPIRDPYPRVRYPKHEKLTSNIALTVWTGNSETNLGTVYIATCPRFDENAFAAFRDAFRGRGPERFPTSQMVPGGN
jgi:Protein of unknown function (DUF3105)